MKTTAIKPLTGNGKKAIKKMPRVNVGDKNKHSKAPPSDWQYGIFADASKGY